MCQELREAKISNEIWNEQMTRQFTILVWNVCKHCGWQFFIRIFKNSNNDYEVLIKLRTILS